MLCNGCFGSFSILEIITFLKITVMSQKAKTASRIQDIKLLFSKSKKNRTTTIKRIAFSESRNVQRFNFLVIIHPPVQLHYIICHNADLLNFKISDKLYKVNERCDEMLTKITSIDAF